MDAQMLEGKVALITGASYGMGRTIAELFAEEGACVVLTARHVEQLNEVVEGIRAKGGKAVGVVADVCSTEDTKRVFKTAIETYGDLDILINNAGIGEQKIIDDTSDEWIMTRVGIKERHILTEEGLGTSYLARKAAKQLLKKTGTDPDSIDAIIVCTTTPDYKFPSTASIVLGKLGLKNAFAFDLEAACCGFLYGLDQAASMIQCGRYRKVIVIGADKMSSLVDYRDRTTCVLFGDGAGAVLVEATEEENVGVQNTFFRTDGLGLPFLHMKAGGSVCPASHFTVNHRLHYLYQEGRTVFRYAVTNMGDDVLKVMENNNLTADDVKWVIPHEANMRIIEAVTKRVGIPMEKVMVNIQHYGNTSAATIPLALWDFEKQLKKGDNVIFTAFGAGFVHGASLYKWAYDGDKVAEAR